MGSGVVTVVIIGRELAVTGLRAMAIDEGVVIAADKYGKVKTVMQIIAIIPLLLHYPLFGRKRASDWKFSALHRPCAHDIFRPELLL